MNLNLKKTNIFSRDYCSKYGEITECVIMRDRENRSRGFAFVSFKGLCLQSNQSIVLLFFFFEKIVQWWMIL
jgi:hypothetical protein